MPEYLVTFNFNADGEAERAWPHLLRTLSPPMRVEDEQTLRVTAQSPSAAAIMAQNRMGAACREAKLPPECWGYQVTHAPVAADEEP